MIAKLFKNLFLCFALFASALILSGCLSPEQMRANQLRAEQQAQDRRQAQINAISSQCDGYGFKRGTPDFARCVQQESNRNDSCNASRAAIDQRVRNCQSQCFQSLNPMDCRNRCSLAFNVPPNC